MPNPFLADIGSEPFDAAPEESFFSSPSIEVEENESLELEPAATTTLSGTIEVEEHLEVPPSMPTLITPEQQSDFGLAIAEGPLILVSISLRAGRQALQISPEILGLTATQAQTLKEKQISNMSAPLLQQQQKAVSALKGKRRSIYNNCTLQLNGQLRFVKGSQIEEFMVQYRELQSLRDHWADIMSESYNADRIAFLSRIRAVLSAMGIDITRQGEVLNKCSALVPTLEQVLESFSVELDGPYYIPPASEMVEYNTQMQVAMSERREFEIVRQLREESIARLRGALVGTIEDSRQRLLGVISDEVAKLTEATAIGKATKRRRPLASIASRIKQLLEYCEGDETLEDLLSSVESLNSHLGNSKVDENLLNDQIDGLVRALNIEGVENRVGLPREGVGSLLRGVIRPTEVE
jgi:hypothetical protein